MNLNRVAKHIRLLMFIKLVCLVAIPILVSGVDANTVMASPQDISLPRIAYFEPSPGSTIAIARPTIKASYGDVESGIDALSVRIQVDGIDVTDDATITSARFSYTPAKLADGSHWVAITVRDKSGNEAHQVWSFQVATGSEKTGSGSLPETISALPSGSSETSNIVNTLPPGTTEVANIIDNGIFTQKATARSEDGKCILIINKDTVSITKDRDLLDQITIIGMEEPPAPPAYSNIITPVYNIDPDGTSFYPPISLTISYDEPLIPEGVAEEKLVMAMFDSIADSWSELLSAIDPETNSITATVEHFYAFAIMAHTRPASFTVTNLTIIPREADIGESMAISITLTNTGDLTGTYKVSLKIDNVATETREVTVEGGESKPVSFDICKDTAGIYTVNVDGQSETFRVKTPAPATFIISDLSIRPTEVDIGERVVISVNLTNTGGLAGTYEVSLKIDGDETVYTKWVSLPGGANRIINFYITKNTPGNYTINVNGVSGSFVVKDITSPKPTSPKSTPTAINWPKIGGGMAILVLALVTFLILFRKS